MSLTHDEVQRLLALLDNSQFDELHLEADGIKLSLRRSSATTPTPAPNTAPTTAQTSKQQEQVADASAKSALPVVRATAGLLEVRAPMLGTFYGAPRPGAEPFVTPGARVTADSAVAILEVMKLMNLVAAGVDGEVVEILVRDGELVEYDQVLIRVRPP